MHPFEAEQLVAAQMAKMEKRLIVDRVVAERDNALRQVATLTRRLEEVVTHDELSEAHHAACTCGGAGDGCQACEMYHFLQPDEEHRNVQR